MKAFCILGPTASGKNDFALRLIDQHPNIHIINVDSAQVYKELSIGANKPQEHELALCPHHLYSYKSVADKYDVSIFISDLHQTLEKIKSRGGIPLLVGGTMMYFNQLINGLVNLPKLNDHDVANWRKKHSQFSCEHLYEKLQDVDPALASRISSHDRQRIERGLIVYHLTSTTLTDYQKVTPKAKDNIQWKVFKLNYENIDTHRNIIKTRLDKMLKMGFLDEVQALDEKFSDSSYAFWRYVGYRQLREYIKGYNSLDDACQRVYFATCQLAKRQKTWLKKFDGDEFFVDKRESYELFLQSFSRS